MKPILIVLGYLLLILLVFETAHAEIIRKEFQFRLILQEHLVYDGRVVAGLSYWHEKENKCVIVLPLNKYPKCLQHEVRHCLEGKWHNGPSSEDCFE